MAATVFARMGSSRLDDFREAVEEAAALHARDELFAKYIEQESAEEGPPEWAVAEESDDDEDGSPPDADADDLS